MIPKHKIHTGDILLVNSKSFLSKSIRYFMDILRKKKKIPKQWIGSHAGTFIWLNGDLFVAESVKNGFRIDLFERHYGTMTDFQIRRPSKPYSPDEEDMVFDKSFKLQEISDTYQFWNFIQWIFYILLGINIFGKGGSNITYCYESTRRIRQYVRRDEFPINPEMTSYFDVIENTILIMEG
jgi:hypothetical protein